MSDEAQIIQGSPEWMQARVGSLGASRISEATARTKTGWGASRANLMAELLVERLTGRPTDKFTTTAMQTGTLREPDARAGYEFVKSVDVREVGIIRHPRIRGTHASPDGLIGDDGMIEIKAPQPAAHLEILLSGTIPNKYMLQMAWQMCCADRAWCDFVSYNPDFPGSMNIFIKRVHRSPEQEKELEAEVASFISELDAKETTLRQTYEKAAA